MLEMMGRGRRCEECGRPIHPARLAALPSTTLCIGCREQSDERPLRAEDMDSLLGGGEVTAGDWQGQTERQLLPLGG